METEWKALKAYNTIRCYMVRIITDKELEIINKKIANKKLTNIESNRLSKAIRKKLRQISEIDAKGLLKKLEYNQKAISIEKIIAKTLNENLAGISSIILYGSAIQSNYSDYNDIDVLIVTKEKINGLLTKWRIIKELNNILKRKSINADIEIISRDNLIKSYQNSPTLIYQLKDHKIIYGNLKLPKKTEIYNADLHMKLDWSEVSNKSNGKEIYAAIRNVILVRLILNKIVDNAKLKQSLEEELGRNLILKIKNNKESELERKFALTYLKYLLEITRKEIGGNLWEKVELLR